MAGPLSKAIGVPESGARTSAREDYRDFVRERPLEPSERYALPDGEAARGMDYFWAALKVRGAPNTDRLNDFIRGGWQPARAEDHPHLSGYNVKHHPMLVELGAVREIGPDAPVIKNDLMLMTRPKEYSRQSREEDRLRAEGQINDHMDRLRQVSRRAIGDKTRVSREATRTNAPPADFADDNADL